MVGSGTAIINQSFLWAFSFDSIVSKVLTSFKFLMYMCTFIYPDLVTVSKGKKMEAVAPTCDSSSVDAGESLVTGTFDSPKSTKSGKDSTSKTDSGSSYSVDVGAIVDGDNAMFPDTLLSLTQKKDNGLNKEGISNTIELSSVEDTDGCVPMEMEVLQDKVIGCDSDKKADPTAEELAAIESRRLKEALEGGLSVDKADMTLAELYLMFGKEGKLRMEYEWCKEEVIPEHLCNMLRRLVNLATIQFTDINTKVCSCARVALVSESRKLHIICVLVVQECILLNGQVEILVWCIIILFLHSRVPILLIHHVMHVEW